MVALVRTLLLNVKIRVVLLVISRPIIHKSLGEVILPSRLLSSVVCLRWGMNLISEFIHVVFWNVRSCILKHFLTPTASHCCATR